MNREEQEQFSWVRMSHFNDPRDDARHIICNYDGIDLVRGARRRSAKLDFETFFLGCRLETATQVTHCDTRSFILYPPSAFRYLGIYISKIWMLATDVVFFLREPQGVASDDHLGWRPFQRASVPVAPRDQNPACWRSDWAGLVAWARGPRHSATLRKLTRLISPHL